MALGTTYTIRELDVKLSYSLFEIYDINGNSARFTFDHDNSRIENGGAWKGRTTTL